MSLTIYNLASHTIAASVTGIFANHIGCEGYHWILPGKRRSFGFGDFNSDRIFYIAVRRETGGIPNENFVRWRSETVISRDPNGRNMTVGITRETVGWYEAGEHPRREIEDADIAEEVRAGEWRRYQQYCQTHFGAEMFEIPSVRMHPQCRSPYYGGALSISEHDYGFGSNIVQV